VIRSWAVSNFKAIGDDGAKIDFAGLTILVGANSSGKSSLIQSLLVVAQSFRSRGSTSRALIWNGDLVRLGGAGEVLHEGATDSAIRLRFELALPQDSSTTEEEPREALVEVALVPDEASRSDLIVRDASVQIRSPSLQGEVALRVNRRRRHTKTWSQVEKSPSGAVRLPAHEYSVTAKGFEPDALSWLTPFLGQRPWQAKIPALAAEFDRFVPTAIFAAVKPEEALLDFLDQVLSSRPKIKEAIGANLIKTLVRQQLGSTRIPSDLAPVVKAIETGRGVPAAAALIEDARRRSTPAYAIERMPLPEPFGGAARAIRAGLAEEIRYLGPLREDPRAVYDLPATVSTVDVGVKGQYTAAVLHNNAQQRVTYFDIVHADVPEVKSSLRDAVKYWLQEMNLLDDVRTSEAGKLGYNLAVRSKGTSSYVDLTGVGVGVSQVLPILVQTLLAPPGGFLIFEQPELHLQPAVQSGLADFLLSGVLAGKQILVETHSDHFINRVRRRVAEGRIADPDEVVQIYFVERRKGKARYDPVSLASSGAFAKWPAGFMDHGVNEAREILKTGPRAGS
jgi:predicted ATPase